MSVITKLRFVLSRKDKRDLGILVIVSILISIIETVGISAIMPFISLASNPSLAQENTHFKAVYDFFGFTNVSNFIIYLGFGLILFYIFRGAANIFFAWLMSKFSYGRYHLFAFRLFQNYMRLSYKEFLKRNPAILTKAITVEASNLSDLLRSVLLLISEVFTLALLYALLLIVNWKITIVLSVILILKVVFIVKGLSKVTKKHGEKRNDTQVKFYKIIQESFGNFKIIKLLSNEKEIFKNFADASQGYSQVMTTTATIAQVPRTILEVFGFSILIGVVMYVLYKTGNATLVIPTISMYAMALYRMLPSINRMLTSYNTILFQAKSLDIIHYDLSYEIETEDEKEVKFFTSITLKDVSFSYSEDKEVLKDISLTIDKGSKIAFIGESGGGKSTLVDIIIGIYKPTNGLLSIDDVPLDAENIRSWRSKIGYIPQNIYLFDGTVAENVAFGFEYNEQKIISALKKANIYDFLSTQEGLETKVGEGGIRLSGGQKQRIGIARALYSDPEILVLDEATSALDNETEIKIMNEIYNVTQAKTLIVIAHRLSTIEQCNTIYTFQNGKIISKVNK